MKIISCHIENFGKLSDFSFSFDSDISVIYEENGFGKSTIAAFVMAMFYGLNGYRKKSIEENEYKRYKPWQGGVFGGKLVFEYLGNVYSVTRYFADKADSDEIEIRDYNSKLLVKEFGYDFGREIFGIDKASFERTIFIGQNSVETKSTDDINAKIGNMTDDTTDMNNYESAISDIDKLLNSMSPKRVTGSIYKNNEEIKALSRMVKKEQGLVDEIKDCEKKIKKQTPVRKVVKKDKKQIVPGMICLIIGSIFTIVNVTIGISICAFGVILLFISQEKEEVYETYDDDVVSNKTRVIALRKELDEINAMKERLAKLKEIVRLDTIKYRHLNIAREKLIKAKEQISSRYKQPMLDSFIKYFSAVCDDDIHDFTLDANSDFFVEKYGKLRGVETFSRGYSDLVSFCLRIAYIDSMYENEKPIIIMDDPFVNLDDDKVKRASELLNLISEKYQIIYFTCSKARM